jgi:hypothetical protein
MNGMSDGLREVKEYIPWVWQVEMNRDDGKSR